jgi:pimeloyl-ACP methyl ester carboxylesterase
MPRVPDPVPPPAPPVELPPSRTVYAPGRGELFLRDTGGEGPPVMLLHGWMASADLNWYGAYAALAHAGYRVLAIDHRGHGRGLRSINPFTLSDCAADAAAALELLDAAPATVVGYSMGGAIAQLVARDHGEAVSGLVLSGTAQHWQSRRERRFWRWMGALWLVLALAPNRLWRGALRRQGLRDSELGSWLVSELMRSSARDLAEAGRELGRFDSRPWTGSLRTRAAVVVTTQDRLVSPGKQRSLAAALEAQVFEAPCDHLDVTTPKYTPALLRAVAAVSAGEAKAPAAASVHWAGDDGAEVR